MTSAKVTHAIAQVHAALKGTETEQGIYRWLNDFNLNLGGRPYELIVGSHGEGELTARVVEEAKRVGKVCW